MTTRAEASDTFHSLLSATALEYRMTRGDILALRTAAIEFAHAAAMETLAECHQAIYQHLGPPEPTEEPSS